MAYKLEITHPPCMQCSTTAKYELHNWRNEITGYYCAKHIHAALAQVTTSESKDK